MPFRFDQAQLLKILRKGSESKQRPVDRVAALVYAVHATHGGRPEAEIATELRRQFVSHGFTPEEPAFSEVVRAIAQSNTGDRC